VGGWAVRRLLQALATFAASLLIIFVVMRVAPGDPLVRLDANTPMDPAEVRVLRERFGLDQPFTAQLGNWVAGALRGDFGTSIGHYPETVGRLLSTRLPASLILGSTVLLLNFTLGCGSVFFKPATAAAARSLAHPSLGRALRDAGLLARAHADRGAESRVESPAVGPDARPVHLARGTFVTRLRTCSGTWCYPPSPSPR
jgi:hypothetical protein